MKTVEDNVKNILVRLDDKELKLPLNTSSFPIGNTFENNDEKKSHTTGHSQLSAEMLSSV